MRWKAYNAKPTDANWDEVVAAAHDLDAAEEAVDHAKSGVSAAMAKVNAAANKVIDAKGQVTKAQQNLDAAKNPKPDTTSGDPVPNGDGTGEPKIPKGSPLPNRGPAFGETISGIGEIISGAATIFDAKAHPGNTEMQNLNYANGALSLLGGTADTAEGLILLFGRGSIPFLGSTLGEWASLFDGAAGVVGALGGLGVTIAQMAVGLKHEHDTDVRDTHDLDDALKKYGVTGGPVTPQDISSTLPLAQGFGDPPDSNVPPQGPSQTNPG
jgi:hypothetical protein